MGAGFIFSSRRLPEPEATTFWTWRKFSATATDDSGTAITSRVILGPFRLASDDMSDGHLQELHGTLAVGSGTVSWTTYTASTAEGAVDLAIAETGGNTGNWSAGRNRVVRPRPRGAYACLALKSTGQWAYESVTMAAAELGRIRAA